MHHFKNHTADYYKVCLQLQYFQLRSIQINSDQHLICFSNVPAGLMGSCTGLLLYRCFTFGDCPGVALECTRALSTVCLRCPRVALLALESNTVKTPVTEDWMLRSLLQRSCRGSNMLQHGSTWLNEVEQSVSGSPNGVS